MGSWYNRENASRLKEINHSLYTSLFALRARIVPPSSFLVLSSREKTLPHLSITRRHSDVARERESRSTPSKNRSHKRKPMVDVEA
jgi:hypothetical protein